MTTVFATRAEARAYQIGRSEGIDTGIARGYANGFEDGKAYGHSDDVGHLDVGGEAEDGQAEDGQAEDGFLVELTERLAEAIAVDPTAKKADLQAALDRVALVLREAGLD